MKAKTKRNRVDIHGNVINKSNIKARFEKYLTNGECLRASKLAKWGKKFDKLPDDFIDQDVNRFLEIYELQYKVKAITKVKYINAIKYIEDYRPDKEKEYFPDPAHKQYLNKGVFGF